MVDYLAAIGPIAVALIVYFVRLESRLAKISNDLCWIKKEMRKCQQS